MVPGTQAVYVSVLLQLPLLEWAKKRCSKSHLLVKLVLSNTKPEIIASGEQKGKPSKAKYAIETKAADEAHSRVKNLLNRFPVYPQLDLAFLQNYFS